MKFFFALLLLLDASLSLAQQDQKIGTQKWAYYGEEFYTALQSGKTFERTLIQKILNETHLSLAGKLDVISGECKGNCYRHSVVGYEAARKIMFGELDMLKDTEGKYVLDVYCGKKFYFSNLEEVSSMHDRVNIEHTWPQSKFNGHIHKEMQKSDMHHLYLTDSHANSVRGNTPFGLVPEVFDRMEGEGCSKSRMGLINGGEVYTPPAPHRGNVARALFYFSMHYNLPINRSEEVTLRQWHKIDPIDANEIKRHEAIARHQKVRNPFVDHPEIVEKVIDF